MSVEFSTHHIDKCHVEEDSANEREDPGGGGLDVSDDDSDEHSEQRQRGGQQVVADGLLWRHAGSQKHREVTCSTNTFGR